MKRAAAISAYPSTPVLRRELARAAALGLDVAGYEVAPDGTLRILTKAAFPAQPRDEFEAWDQDGKLG